MIGTILETTEKSVSNNKTQGLHENCTANEVTYPKIAQF